VRPTRSHRPGVLAPDLATSARGTCDDHRVSHSIGGHAATGASGRPRRQDELATVRLRRDTIAIAVAIGVLAVVSLASPVADAVLTWVRPPWREPLVRVLFLLATSHLVMIGFGARRGADLRRELAARRSAEAVLRHRADHDLLTGLANRRHVLRRLDQAVQDGGPLLVGMIDLDRFKQVNDTLGHAAGDRLLTLAAERMARQLPADGVLARVGGDEFMVVLPAGDRVDASRGVLRGVLAELRRPFEFDGLVLEIDASIGVVVCADPAAVGDGRPTDATSALVKHADLAMYAAKTDRLGIVEYSDHLDRQDEERLRLYGDLRRGLDADQLFLVFQPKLQMRDARMVGAEALVRWRHPDRGVLRPDDFLPVAEQTGLIRDLTDVVLDLALGACRRWSDNGRVVPVAVNLSTRSLLDDALPRRVAELLTRHGLPPEHLELEITESTAMSNPSQAIAVLQELAGLGVRLSVDDYGTGHASLAYLSRLPVNTLKIDKSFVHRMDVEPTDATIVRSTIELAHNLGLTVVAEGVEHAVAWNRLQEWGCDEVQGFWTGRPVAPENLLGLAVGSPPAAAGSPPRGTGHAGRR
jgi:diguanylate cyclase (GGDEF)-like protein